MRAVSRRFLSPALFVAGMIAGSAVTLPVAAQQYQPRMQAALSALNNAYAQLQGASADKGGYRLRAMNDIQDAIKNVHLGIRYANRH